MVLEMAHGALAVEDAPVCRHHWVIEPANGRYSRGECRFCAAVRAFENSFYDGVEDDAD